MTKPWKTLEQKVLLERWWMTLREDRVQLPDGEILPEFHVIEYPDWALTIPLTSDRRVVMVEQYRYGIDAVGFEFPAGAMADGEDPEAAARREMLEETGCEAGEWITIGSCAPEPSKHTNIAHLFLARDVRRVTDPDLDVTENITVHEIDLDRVLTLVKEGKLNHGIHLTALFWAMEEGLL